MIAYFLKGGPIMLPILLCSVAAGMVSIILWYRLWQTNHLKLPANELRQVISRKDWTGAVQITNRYPHPFLKPWRVGFQLLAERKSDLTDIEEAVSVEGAASLNHLENTLSSLHALTTALPMLGFLGTIVGLIMSFEKWEQLGAQINISGLSGGIYQAMITTAAGLIAAIPYHLLYHYFLIQINRRASELSRQTTDLFRLIKEVLLREVTETPDAILSSSARS